MVVFEGTYEASPNEDSPSPDIDRTAREALEANWN